MAVQYMLDLGGGIANTELMHLRNLAEFTGAASVIILLHTRKVAAVEILQLLEEKELPADVTW